MLYYSHANYKYSVKCVFITQSHKKKENESFCVTIYISFFHFSFYLNLHILAIQIF